MRECTLPLCIYKEREVYLIVRPTLLALPKQFIKSVVSLMLNHIYDWNVSLETALFVCFCGLILADHCMALTFLPPFAQLHIYPPASLVLFHFLVFIHLKIKKIHVTPLFILKACMFCMTMLNNREEILMC